MYFINLLIDGEPCEVELSLNDIYSKCIKCGTIYRQFFPPKNYNITGRQRRATLSLRQYRIIRQEQILRKFGF
jgi:hypothetical protein